MKSIYLISTPYHFIVACGIASYVDKSDEKILLISPHFDNPHKRIEILKNWAKNPFTEYKLLHTRTDRNLIGKLASIFMDMGDVRKRVDKTPMTAYIFNIEQPSGQLLAHLNHKAGGINICVEDGISIYLDKQTGDKLPKRILKKILYGHWFERCDNLLNCKLIDVFMAFKPELLPEVYAIHIPPDIFSRLKQDGLVDVMSKEYGITSVDYEVIVLLPLSSQAKAMGYDKTFATYHSILLDLKAKHKNVAIKFHPRETEEYLDASGSYAELPTNISVELAFLNWNAPKKVLIGDASTGLYTCKLICPDAEVISVIDLIGFEDVDNVGKVLDEWKITRAKEGLIL
jgi:hypothetical protein